ncbi:MAG: hypothetical protein WDO12_04590 [Pseudomonadota bacterium]
MREILLGYWTEGFMPMPPWKAASLHWLVQAFSRIFGGIESAGLWYPVNRLYAALSLIGLCSFWLRERRFGLLLIAPLLVTLLAAAAHLYPFRDRVILFLVPGALFGIAEAICLIAEFAARWLKPLRWVWVTACLVPVLVRAASSLPPYQSEDIKPALRYLSQQLQPSDAVYVYHGARIAAAYYAPQFGLSRDRITMGECHFGDPRNYLRDLDRLKGNSRVWVLITHSLPDYNEHLDILAYLDAAGARSETLEMPTHQPRGSLAWLASAALYRFDLSDSAIRAEVRAEDFPVHPHAITYACDFDPL